MERDCTIGSLEACDVRYSTIRSSSFVPAGGRGGGARIRRVYWPAVRPMRRNMVAYM